MQNVIYGVLNAIATFFLIGFSASFGAEMAYPATGEHAKEDLRAMKLQFFKESSEQFLEEMHEKNEISKMMYPFLKFFFSTDVTASFFVRIANIRGWFPKGNVDGRFFGN